MLSGILRRKGITALQQELEADHPKISAAVTEHGVVPVRDALQQQLDTVTEIKQRFPWLSYDYIIYGFREYSPKTLGIDLASLTSLEFSAVVDTIAGVIGRPLPAATLTELSTVSEALLSLAQYLSLRAEVEAFASHVGIAVDDLPRLYTTLKDTGTALTALHDEDVAAITVLFDCCEGLLSALGIERSDLATLFRFAGDSDRMASLLKFVDLHGLLSALVETSAPDKQTGTPPLSVPCCRHASFHNLRAIAA